MIAIEKDAWGNAYLAPMVAFSCSQPPEHQCVSHCGQAYCVKSSVSRDTVTISLSEYNQLKEYKKMYVDERSVR